MERQRFEELVATAIEDLPEEFLDQMENVDIVVQDSPSRAQLAMAGRGMTLLGLYEGVPHVRRTRGYNLALPDRIVIFQKPIEARCRSEREIADEVRRVVEHEIAHHFGSDEDTLRRIEARRRHR